MISIDRLEEMTIEELQTKLKNFEEQIKLQNNFIDSLFKATNNSEWLDKSMLDDEVSEVIEKIELDYEQFDQLKAENDELKKKCNIYTCGICGNKEDCNKLYKTLTEIKEIATNFYETGFVRTDCGATLINNNTCIKTLEQILQKISEVEDV